MQQSTSSCLPLRSRIAGKSTNEKGEETTSMTAVDVTALDEVSSIDAAMFEIPADYTEGTLLVPGLSAAPASDEDGDSAEDARDEPQPRLRLRDLLRR